jgi:hypothetical protein
MSRNGVISSKKKKSHCGRGRRYRHPLELAAETGVAGGWS